MRSYIFNTCLFTDCIKNAPAPKRTSAIMTLTYLFDDNSLTHVFTKYSITYVSFYAHLMPVAMDIRPKFVPYIC